MMRRTQRLALTVLTAFALVGGVCLARPAWIQDAGLDVWNLSAAQRDLEAARRLDEELAHLTDAALNTAVLRNSAVEDLVEGRVSLAEALTAFRELNHATPGRVAQIREFYPAATEEESTLRQVLTFAETRLRRDSRRGPVMARLRHEAGAYLASPARSALN